MRERLVIHGLAGSPSTILVEDGCIAALDPDAPPTGLAAELDGRGLTAHPGFLELQVNGIGDLDFARDPSGISRAGPPLAGHGVTAYLPTIVSSPRATIERALDAWRAATAEPIGAVPLGLHLEGPYLSPARAGAHDPAMLRHPDLDEVATWAPPGVRMVTLAPELPGALEAIERLTDVGVVVAIGHTDADAAAIGRAIDAGARCATHLFNAMPPMLHRQPGPAGTLLADERVTVGLIADGVHVDPVVLSVAARAASGRLSIVSDGVGTTLGGIDLANGRRPDGRLAGGTEGIDHGVRLMAKLIGQKAAIDAVTVAPARLLGLDDGRGEIRIGGRADLVLLDADLEVAATVIGGAVVRPARPRRSVR